jgi:hypothetical protein
VTGSSVFPILGYGTFYDVPRGLYLAVEKVIVELTADFNEHIDNYNDFYAVSVVKGAYGEELRTGTFYRNTYEKIPIGQAALTEIIFDPTKRNYLQSEKIEEMVQGYLRRSRSD